MIERINTYTCQSCGGQIVTIDRVEGVTPMMLACRATPGCRGMMQSGWYRCRQDLTPTYEWFRPRSVKGYSREMKQHIRDGGLVIRKIGEEYAKPRP